VTAGGPGSGPQSGGGSSADDAKSFENNTLPLRSKAKFGDQVVALVDGKVIQGNIARPGTKPGTYGIKQKDGTVVDVPKSDLRMPKGGFKARELEGAEDLVTAGGPGSGPQAGGGVKTREAALARAEKHSDAVSAHRKASELLERAEKAEKGIGPRSSIDAVKASAARASAKAKEMSKDLGVTDLKGNDKDLHSTLASHHLARERHYRTISNKMPVVAEVRDAGGPGSGPQSGGSRGLAIPRLGGLTTKFENATDDMKVKIADKIGVSLGSVYREGGDFQSAASAVLGKETVDKIVGNVVAKAKSEFKNQPNMLRSRMHAAESVVGKMMGSGNAKGMAVTMLIAHTYRETASRYAKKGGK
jgi:hypothetical protein